MVLLKYKLDSVLSNQFKLHVYVSPEPMPRKNMEIEITSSTFTLGHCILSDTMCVGK